MVCDEEVAGALPLESFEGSGLNVGGPVDPLGGQRRHHVLLHSQLLQALPDPQPGFTRAGLSREQPAKIPTRLATPGSTGGGGEGG